jgi:hypothetical protein
MGGKHRWNRKMLSDSNGIVLEVYGGTRRTNVPVAIVDGGLPHPMPASTLDIGKLDLLLGVRCRVGKEMVVVKLAMTMVVVVVVVVAMARAGNDTGVWMMGSEKILPVYSFLPSISLRPSVSLLPLVSVVPSFIRFPSPSISHFASRAFLPFYFSWHPSFSPFLLSLSLSFPSKAVPCFTSPSSCTSGNFPAILRSSDSRFKLARKEGREGRKEGRKEGREGGRKKKGRVDGRAEERAKERTKKGRKEGRKNQGRKESGQEGEMEGREAKGAKEEKEGRNVRGGC